MPQGMVQKINKIKQPIPKLSKKFKKMKNKEALAPEDFLADSLCILRGQEGC